MGKLYNIVTNGKPLKGHKPHDVLKNLSALFKSPPEKVKVLISGNRMDIKKGLDESTTRRMLQALKGAGLTCKAEQQQDAATSSADQGTVSDASTGKLEDTAVARVLTATVYPTETRFSVIQAGEITSIDGSTLNFNKPGATNISPVEVTLASVYRTGEMDGAKIKLMIFISGNTRPFTVDAESIKFWKFPDVSSDSVTLSLRRFIGYLHAHHAGLSVDTRTQDFLDGDDPREMDVDETIPATSLGRALEAEGLLVEGDRLSGQEMAFDINFDELTFNREPRIETETLVLTRLAIVGIILSAIAAGQDILGQLALHKKGSLYLSGAGSIMNYIVIWLSVLVSAAIIFSAYKALRPMIKRSSDAPKALLNHLAIFCLYTLVRFTVLVGAMFAMRLWNVRSIALFELLDMRSKSMLISIAKAFWHSGAALAITLSAVFLAIFLSSPSIDRTFSE